MILINKDEAIAIRKSIPNTHIVRTMSNKSKRHCYYCEESLGVFKIISELRGVPVGWFYNEDRR